jgi:hypothetical protein
MTSSSVKICRKLFIVVFPIIFLFLVSCNSIGFPKVIEENNIIWADIDNAFYFYDIDEPSTDVINGYGKYLIDGVKYKIYAEGLPHFSLLKVYVYNEEFDCLGEIGFSMSCVWSKFKVYNNILNLELIRNENKFAISRTIFTIRKTKIVDETLNPLELIRTPYDTNNLFLIALNSPLHVRMEKMVCNYLYSIHFFNYIEDEVEIPVYLRWGPNNKATFYKVLDDETWILAIKIAEYDYTIINPSQIRLDRIAGFFPDSLLLTVHSYK